MAHQQAAPTDNVFLNPSDKFWNLYIVDAEKHDKIRLERWKGDTDGILIFTGLFAAAVATFLVSTIPSLSPDTGDETVALLSQIFAVLGNQTGQNVQSTDPLLHAFKPSPSTVWVNSLWVSSLILSLVSALAATLVQQWSRVYSQGTQRRGSPNIRGPVYAALAHGVDRFHMEGAILSVVSLLHVAVMLFFAGFLVLLWSTNPVVAIVSSTLTATGACVTWASVPYPSWHPGPHIAHL
ncbi:hypothetical protein PENSPDRAFT_683582 [Peniophora sp. CONT]|nr:hypothetical protein PENSPDRAFT_683582 [Peniophora sp. CONT]